MACNCIEKIVVGIEIRYGAAGASFEHSGSQRSEVSYRPYTAAGRVSKHNRYKSIDWVYCPFCSEKINRSEAER